MSYEDCDFEEYVGWLATVADEKRVAFAHEVRVKVEGWMAKDENWTSHYSDRVMEAIDHDVSYIVRRGKNPGLYQRHLDKQKRAVERRAATRAKTAERFGPGHNKFGNKRDSQKSKLYAAERHALHQWRWQERWKTVPEMQAYVDKLLASAWWRRRWPTIKKIRVEDGRGRRSACSGSGYIAMPRWSRFEAVILHEIAHEIVGRTMGHRNCAAHGREFAQVFLELVGHKIGKDARHVLKVSFQVHKVKHTKARTRKPMSPEQKAAAVERLQAANAARSRLA